MWINDFELGENFQNWLENYIEVLARDQVISQSALDVLKSAPRL